MDDQLDPEDSEENTFTILLATDCHLGYGERDPIRSNDSLVTFEEILSIAKEKNVDFILLGGDLFHENKPSRKTLHSCLKLLRQYCMGNRPVSIEFLSDQSENFKNSSFPIVNYEDPNLNVAIPLFTIHGNHDDPTGPGNLCALDLLSIPGLVNYFGKCTDLERIQISPLLMQKGCTKLSLYGLGSIRDERLHRMFSQSLVETLRPRENPDAWFNIFVIHQNRVAHGPKNYIPGKFLDDYLDLVIWGHEHECKITPEWNEWPPDHKGFFITQPGSSVATSLCHGEAVPKHVGLLQVFKKSFKMTKIPLQTVRPFYIEDVYLSESGCDILDPAIQKKVMEFCSEKVDILLDKALYERSGHPKQPAKPLIRLRVEHRDQSEMFSAHRFGQKYIDKVANPKDIIHFHKKIAKEKKEKPDIDFDQLQDILNVDSLTKVRVEDLVKEYFQTAEEKGRLSLLSETGMGSAVQEFVDKDVRTAIQDLIKHQVTKVQKHLKNMNLSDNTIDREISNFTEERRKNSKEELTEIERTLAQSRRKETNGHASDIEDDMPDAVRGRGQRRGSRGGGRTSRGQKTLDESFGLNISAKQPRGRRGRGATATRGRGNSEKQTKKGTSSRVPLPDVECSDSEEESIQPRKRQKATSRATSRSKGISFDSDDSN